MDIFLYILLWHYCWRALQIKIIFSLKYHRLGYSILQFIWNIYFNIVFMIRFTIQYNLKSTDLNNITHLGIQT